jgi:hypothetical protein
VTHGEFAKGSHPLFIIGLFYKVYFNVATFIFIKSYAMLEKTAIIWKGNGIVNLISILGLKWLLHEFIQCCAYLIYNPLGLTLSSPRVVDIKMSHLQGWIRIILRASVSSSKAWGHGSDWPLITWLSSSG